jgi:hypothetical protein
MPTATYAGHDVSVNDEGFLTDPARAHGRDVDHRLRCQRSLTLVRSPPASGLAS